MNALHCGMQNNETVEVLIASVRDLGGLNKKGWSRETGRESTCTPLEIASEGNQTEVVCLLERFMANPTQTRLEVRAKLGVLDEFVAELFALTCLQISCQDSPSFSVGRGSISSITCFSFNVSFFQSQPVDLIGVALLFVFHFHFSTCSLFFFLVWYIIEGL